jgi:hypothetical protein
MTVPGSRGMAVTEGLLSVCAPLTVSYTLPCRLTTDFSCLVRLLLCALWWWWKKKKLDEHIWSWCFRCFGVLILRFVGCGKIDFFFVYAHSIYNSEQVLNEGRRWLALSLRKRIPPNVSTSLGQWVHWDRSGLTVEMKPDLLVSDRLSWRWPGVTRSRSSMKIVLRFVVGGSFIWIRWETISVLVPLIRGVKKVHDWVVDQLSDLFRTTHKVKTSTLWVYWSHGKLTVYLVNVSGPVPLVLDLHITHNRFGSSSDPDQTLVLTDTYITLMISINH